MMAEVDGGLLPELLRGAIFPHLSSFDKQRHKLSLCNM